MRHLSLGLLLTLLLAAPALAVGDLQCFSRGHEGVHEHGPTTPGGTTRATVSRRVVAPVPDRRLPPALPGVRHDRLPARIAATPAPPARLVQPLRR